MIESITDEKAGSTNSRTGFLVGLSIALVMTVAFAAGWVVLQRRNAAKVAAKELAEAKAQPTPRPTPELQVLLDEAIVKSGQAALSGTVKNISPNAISGIKVDLELFHREGNGADNRSIQPVPVDLPPNGEAKFQFSVPQKTFRTLRVVRVSSLALGRDVAFVTAPGARRPTEGPTTITVTEDGRPQPKGKGEIFINTPDTPVKVP